MTSLTLYYHRNLKVIRDKKPKRGELLLTTDKTIK
jgi:hypothetical protein